MLTPDLPCLRGEWPPVSLTIKDTRLPALLEELLDAGYQVEFEKDDAGYVAHVCEGGFAAALHTGIADTPAGALEAAAAGLEER
jgi:hypothetical protein